MKGATMARQSEVALPMMDGATEENIASRLAGEMNAEMASLLRGMPHDRQIFAIGALCGFDLGMHWRGDHPTGGRDTVRGEGRDKLRVLYRNMIYRCYSSHVSGATARNYRDKGIRVCDAWIASYQEFRDWAMAHGYEEGLSIDRIDPDGNYCPENCRWITIDENRRRRSPRAATLDAK